jgi:hypothetical protein
MKTILAAFITFVLTFTLSAQAGGEFKEVCKDKTDKTGKVLVKPDGTNQKTCKKIKVHKKVEGEKIPNK